jgi:ubiquinone/menaquinone biosynthesis C-methylase UbiE
MGKKNLYLTDKKSDEDYQVQWDIYSKILNRINLPKEQKILDAGCGNGSLAEHMKDYPYLYGFDFDEGAVKLARKKGYKEVKQKNIYETGYLDKEFDSTICIQVLPYVINPDRAFEELIRITKEKLIISVPNFNWLKNRLLSSKKLDKIHNSDFHSNYTCAKFLKKLAKEHNLPLKIFYLSNKGGFLRNFFGNQFASEVVGVFYLK